MTIRLQNASAAAPGAAAPTVATSVRRAADGALASLAHGVKVAGANQAADAAVTVVGRQVLSRLPGVGPVAEAIIDTDLGRIAVRLLGATALDIAADQGMLPSRLRRGVRDLVSLSNEAVGRDAAEPLFEIVRGMVPFLTETLADAVVEDAE
jgi:hypothetical protein